jgi:hypothetical protein
VAQLDYHHIYTGRVSSTRLGTVRLPTKQEYVPLEEIWPVLHPPLGAAPALAARAGMPGWLRGNLGDGLQLTVGGGGRGGGAGGGGEPFPLFLA